MQNFTKYDKIDQRDRKEFDIIMIKNKKLLVILSVIFLSVEAALGVLLQTAQHLTPINLRYTAVVLACLFFILFAEKSLSFLFTMLALVCTVGADYFLVYSEEMQQLPAMLFFSVTQIAYFLRLYFEDKSKTRSLVHLICRAIISAVAVGATFAVLRDSADAVAVVSMFYYANLILNIVFAFIAFEKPGVFAIGLLLFVLCDTVIGLSLINTYLPIPEGSFIYKLINPGFDLAWAFYLPSQALLAISLLPKRMRMKNPLIIKPNLTK